MKRLMRRPWLTLAVIGAALPLVVFGVVASGIVPLRASSGHWLVTERLLRFTMQRSVVTHASFVEVPFSLDNPALVRRGAMHFDRGCAGCHGNVGGDTPRVLEAMLPPPPYLPPRVGRWRPEELFYIVRHGVKFTGMPGWPAPGRDDEVWAVVAFLRRLPEMSAEEYAQLARGEPGSAEVAANSGPDIVRENCAACHGVDGRGRGGAAPVLTGQRARYMDGALRAYAAGRRRSGTMETIAASLNERDWREAVDHYAAMTPAGIDEAARPSAIGAAIAEKGIGDTVPACVACHDAEPANPAYPRLNGQYAEYLVQQLKLLKARRGGSEYVGLMHSFVDGLTDEQVTAVAAHFASRAPTP